MSQEIKIIRFGVPKGSLNDEDRGNTCGVATNAGYDVRGYEPGRESPRLYIANDKEIKLFLRRPQGIPVELGMGLLDIGITGGDWFEEERINGGRNVRKIGDLEYGQTRLVIAVSEKSEWESLSDVFKALKDGRKERIMCSTEYVNLTARTFMQNESYLEIFGRKSPFIQYRGLTRGRNRFVEISGSDGATEASIELGYDVIVDNSQSGQSLIDNHLREIGQIMVSSAGLYAGPSCIGWKEDKTREIYEMLYGAVVGKRYFDIKFDVPSGNTTRARDYLIAGKLCADEPTVVPGDKCAQFNVVIPGGRYPEVIRALRSDFGATAFVRSKIEQYIK